MNDNTFLLDEGKATLADAERFGIKYDPFHHDRISLKAYVEACDVNPYKIADGKLYFLRNAMLREGVTSLIFTFDISAGMPTDEAMVAIGAWTHALGLSGEKCHIAYRTMGDYSDNDNQRFFVYRIYLNDGECTEHPEMLVGAPMGMYHCPVCMEMLVAGLRHPSKEEIRTMNEELIADVRGTEE